VLKDWVSSGGRIIAVDRALNSLTNLDIGLTKKTNENENENNKYNLVKYNERNESRINQSISGAIFKIYLDNTHPIGYGYDDDYYFSLKIGNSSYQLLENGYNVGYINNDPKPTSGFAGEKALDKISNSLVFGHQKYGEGSFIYMVDNPLFRSFWENGKLLLVNSIFFVN
jgi:hypothetical protein